MSTKFDDEIDRFMARQAQHKPHDSCRGASDIDYHSPEDYMDQPEATSEPKQPDEYADLS